MMDSVPTTSNNSEINEEVEVPNQIVADVCGFTLRRSSELPVGKAPVHEDSDDYNMEHPNRGTCLVLNHATYDDQQPRRLGTYVDVKRIQQTFGSLGFNVDVCNDYKYDDIKKKIKSLSKQDHSKNDCLCVIVLTHGKRDNMIFASDRAYSLDVLWEPFTADNCLTLAGKPKIFFISACRGEKRDGGVTLNFTADISPQRTETDGGVSMSYVIPTEADFLFGFSTPAGYASWRSLQEGTWYIQCLCDVFDKFAESWELVDMLRKTAQEVSKRSSFVDNDDSMHNKKQVPVLESRLLRRVYFMPRHGAIASRNCSPQRETNAFERADSKRKSVTPQPNETSKSKHCYLM